MKILQNLISGRRFNRLKLILVTIGLLAPVVSFAFLSTADAAYLSKPSIYLTNMNTGGASSIIVEFTTSASNTGGPGGSLVFSGWTGSGGTGTVATTQTVATTYNSINCTTILAGTGTVVNLPGSPTATGTAGTGTITITDATAMTASTQYCFVLTNGITANPTSAGQSVATLTAGTDSATATAIDVITNDQIVVNATVPPSFTMGLGTNSDNFTANLSTGAIGTTTGVVVTFNTNAQNGWYLFGSDANTGLKSPSQSYTIASTTPNSNTTIVTNANGYVSAVPAASFVTGTGAGVLHSATAFVSTVSGMGSGLTATTPEEMAYSTGTAGNAQVTVKEYATIGGVTPAASDYSDTITLVGAGSF